MTMKFFESFRLFSFLNMALCDVSLSENLKYDRQVCLPTSWSNLLPAKQIQSEQMLAIGVRDLEGS